MGKKIQFCTCAGEYLLKNTEQNLKKETVITLVFKLKVLVIGNEFDLDGDI